MLFDKNLVFSVVKVNPIKLDNLDLRPLSVENEAFLKCNFTP